jgi:hypothetical protein
VIHAFLLRVIEIVIVNGHLVCFPAGKSGGGRAGGGRYYMCVLWKAIQYSPFTLAPETKHDEARTDY